MLSKREKLIAVGVGAALAVLLGDWYGLTPYLEARAKLDKDIAKQRALLTEDRDLAAVRPAVEANWKKLLDAGLATDVGTGERQLDAALRDWAQAARVHLERGDFRSTDRAGDFILVRVDARASANSPGLAVLLHRIETAPFPLRIDGLTLTPTKDGTDALTVTLKLSSAVFSPQPDKRPAAGART